MSIKMSIGDIVDRYSICKLKSERLQLDNSKELQELEKEIHIYESIPDFVDRMYEINGKIWDLEADIRKKNEEILGLEEVGRRAIKIRELNTIRVSCKNEINSKYNEGYIEYKMNHGCEKEPSVIVSLTTVPERLSNDIEEGIKLVLKSLCEQEYDDYEIHFNIPYVAKITNKEYTIPDWLHEYKLKYKKLKIFRTEDVGPPTKFIPTLQRIKNSEIILIVVDDDLVYHKNMVREHVKYQNKFVDSVICYDGRGASEALYHDIRDHWVLCVTQVRETEGLQHYKSASYKAKLFTNDFYEFYFNKTLSDDVLVSRYFTDNGIKIYVVPYEDDIHLFETKELWDKNQGVETFPILRYAVSIQNTGCSDPEVLKFQPRFYEPKDLGRKKMKDQNIEMVKNIKDDPIKFWDQNVVERHIGSELQVVKAHFNKMKIKNINYVDIGANVGKFYDLFLEEGYDIDNAIMVEPSHDLYSYMLEKFKNKPNCKIYNLALSDKNGVVKFESIIETCNEYPVEEDSINLGLSKISEKGKDVELMSGNDFFIKYVDSHKDSLNFIKIDTENQDYFILDSITNYIKNLKNKPYIVIEHNYHNDMSYEKARLIYENFLNECGYEGLHFDELFNAVYLKPKNDNI